MIPVNLIIYTTILARFLQQNFAYNLCEKRLALNVLVIENENY